MRAYSFTAVLVLSLLLMLSMHTWAFDPEDRVKDVMILSTTPDYDPVRYESAMITADVWRELGMDVTVRPLDFHRLIADTRDEPYDFDAFTLGWSGRIERLDPDMFLYSLFHSSQAMPGGNNRYGFMHDEYDRLVEQQRTEMDIDARQQLVYEAQDILAEEIPKLTLFFRDEIQAYNHENFEGFLVMPGEGINNEWTPMKIEPLGDQRMLRIASTEDLDTLNPLAATTVWDWKNLRLIYDKLVRISPEIEPLPWAAESWEITDDVVIDVTLRPDMKFHDGYPVRTEDVSFTFNYMMEWGVPYFDAFLGPLESVEAVDESVIRFTLKEPYAPFLTNTLGQIPILPEHIWENVVEDYDLDHPEQWDNPTAIGSGPFAFNYWRRGEELRMDTFEDYFEPASIDGILHIVYGHAEAVLGALEMNQADMNAWRFEPLHIAEVERMDHMTVTEAPDIGFYYLGFNLRRPPFSDKAFREAISYAVDYELIIEALLQGYGQAGAAGMVIAPGNEFWNNPDLPRQFLDVDEARYRLEEAGYRWDDDGYMYYPE